MKKVTCIRRFSEMSVAFMVLGLTGLIWGLLMLYSGISCYLYNLSIGFGTTNLIVNAVINGLVVLLSGIVLMILCLFSLFPIISKFKVDFIWGLSVSSLLFSVAGFIRNLFMRSDVFSEMVSLFTVIVCGIIFYMVNYTKRQMDKRALRQGVQSDMTLRKVG